MAFRAEDGVLAVIVTGVMGAPGVTGGDTASAIGITLRTS